MAIHLLYHRKGFKKRGAGHLNWTRSFLPHLVPTYPTCSPKLAVYNHCGAQWEISNNGISCSKLSKYEQAFPIRNSEIRGDTGISEFQRCITEKFLLFSILRAKVMKYQLGDVNPSQSEARKPAVSTIINLTQHIQPILDLRIPITQ